MKKQNFKNPTPRKDFIIGDQVEHFTFGKGEVIQLSMSGPVIKFREWESEIWCNKSTLINLTKLKNKGELTNENNKRTD